MLPRDARAARQAPARLPAAGVPRRRTSSSSSTSIPTRPTVTATFAFRRNPAAADADRRAPLVLDGEQQDERRASRSTARRCRRPACAITPSTLTLRDPPDAGTLTIRSRIAPSRNVALEGPLRFVGRVLHAVRARRLSPHHVLSRPPRRARALHGDAARRPRRAIRCCCRTATSSPPGRSTAAATSRRGTTRSPSRPTCSRWSPATSPRSTTRSSRASGRTRRAAHLLDAAATSRAAGTRWSR